MPSSAEAEEQDRTLLLDVEEPARSFHIHRSCRTWWLAASFLLLAAFAVLLGQNITVRLKQDARSVDAERPSRLVADEALSALKTAKKDTLLKANTSEHPGRPSHHLRAAGVLQAPEAQSANESASPAAECKTAEPGDKCYKAVLWAKWIGLVEHPGWYEGLDRTTANRHAIQEWLADNGQGGCKKPCGGSIGGYPLPPLDKGKPSLYCFSVARKGPEMDIMYMQQQIRSGIFGCDGFSVYSDSHVNIDGFQTKLIPSTYAGVSRDGYAANSQVFMKTWMAILTGSEWYKYDFIAKASNGMRRRVSGAKMWSVKQFHRAPDISLGGRSRLRLFPVAVARTCRQVCWSECVLSELRQVHSSHYVRGPRSLLEVFAGCVPIAACKLRAAIPIWCLG